MIHSLRFLLVFAVSLAGAVGLRAAHWTAAELAPVVTQHAATFHRLLQHLDLTDLDLLEVRKAAEAGEPAQALEALLRHFARRSPPDEGWLPPFTTHGDAISRADAILEDYFRIQGAAGQQPRREDGGLDWEWRGPADDPEWAWLLNRHAYFESLLLAYEASGDTRYIDRLSNDLVDWVIANPYPARLTFSAAWRPLEVARRILNSWTHIFFSLQDEPAFTAEARLLLLSSLPEHADALANHYSFWGGNHLITETTALATIPVAWPEFADADAWLNTAMERFHAQLMEQTYPDGAFDELTNHYQKIVWLGVERFCALLAATSRDDPGIERDLVARRADMRRYLEGVARPDGVGPLNNAADRENNIAHLQNAGVERQFPSTPLSDGGTSPSLYFPWAGHAVMRDSWEDGQEWAFFDIGPYGSAHQHRDALHVSVWFDGNLFLADSGRYTYQPGPWRDYFKGPRAHNVMLLDGAAPLPGPRTVNEPLRNTAVIKESFAWFAGRATFPPSNEHGKAPAVHERAVLHLPGVGWIIADFVRASGAHALESIWNFGPSVTEGEADTHLRLVAAHDVRGALRPETRYLVGETEPIAGWYSEQFGEKVPTLAKHALFRTRGPAFFVWGVPTRPDATVTATGIDARGTSIEFVSGDILSRVRFRFTPRGIEVDLPPTE